MSQSCAQWRGDIGAYVAGALDGRARDRLTRHLAACDGCRADYDELVPVRDWLGLLARTAGWPEASPAGQRGHPPLNSRLEPGTRVPARAAGKPRASWPRSWRWPVAAGIALIAAVAAVALILSPGAPAGTFRAVDSVTGVSAHAQLHDTPTGTQIELTITGLPGQERCILLAETHDGSDIAASWKAMYNGSARIAGTTAFHASQLTALRIESDTGVPLLIIRV
ncbi:MAG TPA: anti-sigma factor [Streptosporangiaceae bacterium]|jgi:hypothetical protein